ncbi:MAG: GTP cyclohydrolase I FolE2, partial [Dictyoglomi bacterium]|nr:GTP cyclohydrolase I FolE2 [Dictyoglomota bacterium]
MKTLRDIQSEFDDRNIPLRRVGIRDIKYPLKVMRKDGGIVDTIATFNLYVNLPHHFRGTHMSRFVEALEEFNEMLSWEDLKAFAIKLKDKLTAEASH